MTNYYYRMIAGEKAYILKFQSFTGPKKSNISGNLSFIINESLSSRVIDINAKMVNVSKKECKKLSKSEIVAHKLLGHI